MLRPPEQLAFPLQAQPQFMFVISLGGGEGRGARGTSHLSTRRKHVRYHLGTHPENKAKQKPEFKARVIGGHLLGQPSPSEGSVLVRSQACGAADERHLVPGGEVRRWRAARDGGQHGSIVPLAFP